MAERPDELDTLAAELLRVLRARGDEGRPCEVLELTQQVVPYRLLRRAGGFETNEDYEHAMMRLLAGERGYLRGDERMQKTLADELATKHPDTALFREFARSHVAFTSEGLAAAAAVADAPGSTGGGAPTPRVAAPAGSAPGAAPSSDPTAPPPRRVSAVTAAFHGLDGLDVDLPEPEADMAASPNRAVTAKAVGGKCRFCAASLPDGRKLVFCPFCGNDLTTVQCPACSTELELGWKFCVTCGRAMTARPGGTPADTPAQGST